MVGRLASPPSESFPRAATLRHRAEFMRCYRRGRKRHGSLLTLHVHSSREEAARLGITASRKVGNAVIRHGVKRRIREIFRRWPGRAGLAPLDIVAHVKVGTGGVAFGTLKRELEQLLVSLPRKETPT